jgi:hypothetical protein
MRGQGTTSAAGLRRGRTRTRWSAAAPVPAVLLLAAGPASAQADAWDVHATNRPRPAVVDPGPAGPPGRPPSDAIVLFDGRDLSAWTRQGGGDVGWRIVDGALEVVGGTGSIATRQAFGDVQLHVEWMAPAPPRGDGQNRGNSGVFLMGLYEVQILDSYRNDTYPDGQAAALYGQEPPLVNASRPPGAWQHFDIVFRRPRFDANGGLLEPARITVLHNGVLVHDAVALHGRTVHAARASYSPHADALPLMLQDHGDPVRFRSIWVRPLE